MLFGTLASAPGKDALTASRTSERTSRNVGVFHGIRYSSNESQSTA
jgi:hypothetical protein